MSEQAVSNTEAEPVASVEGSAAQEDDLDALLNEFDSTTESSNAADQNTEQQGLSNEDRQLLNSYKQEKENEAVNKEISDIRGHLPEGVEISEKIFKQLVLGMASDDARIADAFALRGTNPGKWEAVQKSIAQEIAGEFGSKPDAAATETHNAIANAVRSASTSSPQTDTPKDLSKMSDKEFQAETRKALGY